LNWVSLLHIPSVSCSGDKSESGFASERVNIAISHPSIENERVLAGENGGLFIKRKKKA